MYPESSTQKVEFLISKPLIYEEKPETWKNILNKVMELFTFTATTVSLTKLLSMSNDKCRQTQGERRKK